MKKLRVGTDIFVYYDPQHPEKSVLETGMHAHAQGPLLAMATSGVLIAFFAFAVVLKMPKKLPLVKRVMTK